MFAARIRRQPCRSSGTDLDQANLAQSGAAAFLVDQPAGGNVAGADEFGNARPGGTVVGNQIHRPSSVSSQFDSNGGLDQPDAAIDHEILAGD
jgi:hypothetical protein